MRNIYIDTLLWLLLLFVAQQYLSPELELELQPARCVFSLSLMQSDNTMKVNLQNASKQTDGYLLFILLYLKQWQKYNEFCHLLCLKLNLEDAEDAAAPPDRVASCGVQIQV